MNYVLVGGLGNINQPLVKRLIAAGQAVTVISSNPERSAAIVAAGARPAIGKLEDVDFLTAAFKGADVVYTMVPPKYDAPDWKKFIHQIGINLATAIGAAGVKKVVNLSSIGAHLPVGCGPVSGLYFVEQEFNKLESVDVLHLRPSYFYNNFLNAIGMIKTAGFYGNNYSAGSLLPLTAPVDIAAVAAEKLLNPSFSGKSVLYITSDEKTSLEVTAAFGAAIGKPDLPYVEFSDEDALKGMLGAGLPQDIALNFVEMGQALRTGIMIGDYLKHRGSLQETKLADFAKSFAEAYAKA